MVYRTPIETTGVKKTMELAKIFRIPMSPSWRVFTKNGRAANDIALHSEPVIVYAPICLKESFNNIDFIFCNNSVKIDQQAVILTLFIDE